MTLVLLPATVWYWPEWGDAPCQLLIQARTKARLGSTVRKVCVCVCVRMYVPLHMGLLFNGRNGKPFFPIFKWTCAATMLKIILCPGQGTSK